jgi:rhodanese-related sulfurtransferase
VDFNQISEFIVAQWHLVAAFGLLLVALLLLFWRERASGAFRIDPSTATRLINKEQALVLDLRDNNAFGQGHIVGAKNIPNTRLAQDVQELAKFKEKPIILVCDMGRLSPASGTLLRKQGFTKVYMLTGGIQAWRSAGLPLTTS